MIKVDLVFPTSNFSINKIALVKIWMSFTCSNLALKVNHGMIEPKNYIWFYTSVSQKMIKINVALKLRNLCHSNVTLLKIKLLVCRSLSLFSVQTVTLVTHDIFSNFSCGFLNPPKIFQSNLWLSDLLDLKNLQDYFKKAFYYKKVFWPFTVWITYSSDLKFFSITRTIFFSQWVRTILVTKYRSHRSFLHKMMNYVDCELIHQ